MKKKTNAEFLSEVYELVGNDYVFNEEYLTAVKKVSVTHTPCGNTYEVAPNKFLTGRRCPKCSRKTANIKAGKTNSVKIYQDMCEKVGKDFKEWLIEKYFNEEKPTREISELLYGTPKNSPNVLGWMKKLEIPSRKRSNAVALQWKGNHERKKKQAEFAVNHLGEGTEARKKLIKMMQNPEYRLKASMAKRGPKNPMWDSSIDEKTRAKFKHHSRQYIGYKQFRKSVYERDDYTCRVCKESPSGNLVVHHLNSFTDFPHLRIDINNGITLCNSCHKDYHSKFGMKGATEDKFKEYINQALAIR